MSTDMNDVNKELAKLDKPPGHHLGIDDINATLDELPDYPEPQINGRPKQDYYSVYKAAKNFNVLWITVYLISLTLSTAIGLAAKNNSGLQFCMILTAMISFASIAYGTASLWQCHQLDIDYSGPWEAVKVDSDYDDDGNVIVKESTNGDPVLDAMRERIHDRCASRTKNAEALAHTADVSAALARWPGLKIDGTTLTSLRIEIMALDRRGVNTDNLYRLVEDVALQAAQTKEQLGDAVNESNRQREVLDYLLAWIKSQGYSKEMPQRAKIEALFK